MPVSAAPDTRHHSSAREIFEEHYIACGAKEIMNSPLNPNALLVRERRNKPEERGLQEERSQLFPLDTNEMKWRTNGCSCLCFQISRRFSSEKNLYMARLEFLKLCSDAKVYSQKYDFKRNSEFCIKFSELCWIK